MIAFHLFMSLLTIGVASLVLHVWLPHVRGDSAPHRLLLWGITMSFMATIGDNIFWGLASLSKLKGWPSYECMLKAGPYADLLFQHAMRILAAACHLEAARRANVIASIELATVTMFAIVGAIAVFAFLMIGR